ncbi:MAG: AAA family ATPase [Brooklawnia sp.]|nr:AAA family ATPase [Brooklawnia sp.]
MSELRLPNLDPLAPDERELLATLHQLGVPLWAAPPNPPGADREFKHPSGWNEFIAADNPRRLQAWQPGWALCARTGPRLGVVDVDSSDEAIIQAAGDWARSLDDPWAVIRSPRGGRHLYISGPDRPVKYSGSHAVWETLGLECTELFGGGQFIYVPGTRRPKYQGGGYEILHREPPPSIHGQTIWRELAKAARRAKRPTDQPTGDEPPSEEPTTPPPAGSRRAEAYTERVLRTETSKVKAALPGSRKRNNTLNDAAYALGQLTMLSYDEVEEALLAVTSLPRGEASDTIRSGWTAGSEQRHSTPATDANAPDRDDYQGDPVSEPTDEGAREDSDAFQADVKRRAYRLEVEQQARLLIAERNRPPREPLDVGSLGEVLARPQPPAARIVGLAPWEGTHLVTAQRKVGKTTLLGNLSRCLITGEDFLGRFPVKPLDGNVAMLNLEVSGAQLARWLDEIGVDHQRLMLVNLRGRANPLGDPETRGELAALLRARETESLIVDPFGRAFNGDDQNSAGQVGRFMADLDVFARAEVGALDLFVSNHAGWVGERSRGSTALEDAPDTLWRLVRGPEEGSPRYFSALGRDVDIAEDMLEFDEESRRLTLTGLGGRAQAAAVAKVGRYKDAILHALEKNPEGLSGAELKRAAQCPGGMGATARGELLADGLIVQSPRQGRGGGQVYRLAPQRQ